MSKSGLVRVLQVCESLRIGLEASIEESDKSTLDVMLGRVLDAARDNKSYDQSFITRYVIWLTKYRSERACAEARRNKGDPYATSQISISPHVHDEEIDSRQNYFGR